MTARFQVISVARLRPVSAPRGADAVPHPRERGFTWRFMSANNRSLAMAAHVSADVESCLAAIRALQQALPRAVGETVRNRHRQWIWRVRLDGEIVATATRSYARQVRAQMTCAAFLHLVATTAESTPVRVMYR